MSSITLADYPIVTALVESEKILGANRNWRAINETQQEFLTEYFDVCRTEATDLTEIESIADTKVDSVNSFLASHGFPDVQLDDQGDGVYAASVMNVLLKWIKPGTPGKFRASDGNVYDSFSLKSYAQGAVFNLVEIDQMQALHVEIETEDGTIVNFLVDMPRQSNKLSDLPSTVIQSVLDQLLRSDRILGLLDPLDIARMKVRSYCDFDNIVLPMLDLEQSRNVDWLLGMSTAADGGANFSIVQALQKNRLKMNEFGVKAESAFGMAALECIPSELAVTAPFFMWLTRPSTLKRPLFVAYVDYDAWNNPGSLD